MLWTGSGPVCNLCLYLRLMLWSRAPKKAAVLCGKGNTGLWILTNGIQQVMMWYSNWRDDVLDITRLSSAGSSASYTTDIEREE